MSDLIKVRPFFLESEMFKLRVASTTAPPSEGPEFGDTFLSGVSWSTGGNPMTRPIAVSVLGSKDDVFYAAPDLFLRSAMSLGGEPIFSPPPFACPCSDGLLIIYTLRRSNGDLHDVHGSYILFSRDRLEKELKDEPIFLYWQRATKSVDMATMLKSMGFGETRPWMLN